MVYTVGVYSDAPNIRRIATVSSEDVSDADCLANARLIAAAPDLLAACKEAHDAIDTLFAILIRLDPYFSPSRSGQPWAAIISGNTAIKKAENPQ